MNKGERQRLKQLANDAIIASYGSGSIEQQLAEVLEKAIDHIEYLRAEYRPICEDCERGGKTYDEAEEDGEV